MNCSKLDNSFTCDKCGIKSEALFADVPIHKAIEFCMLQGWLFIYLDHVRDQWPHCYCPKCRPEFDMQATPHVLE